MPNLVSTYGPEQYIALGQESRATAVGGAIYGLPNRWDVEPDPKPIPEAERKPSKLTALNATDASVRLAQYVRISGLLGVAALSKPVTARGSATRNVPDHLSGMCPDERCNFVPDMPDALTQQELRFAERYRSSMKGTKFAASMLKAKGIRNKAYWRNAFPFWPIGKDGAMLTGFQHNGERMFDIGGNLVSLRTLYAKHMESEAKTDKDADAQRKSRASELALLIKEQEEDKKRSKRGRI
jgi:hypothetical protein